MTRLATPLLIAALLGACVVEPELGSTEQGAHRIDDDGPVVPDPDYDPPEPDPEPELCSRDARVVDIDSSTLDAQLRFLLIGTRIQLSHTGDGDVVIGEPRELALRRNIPAYKLDEFLDDIERDCASAPDPAACEIERLQDLNDPVVHTITPIYASFLRWGGAVASQTGAAPIPMHIPIVEKTLLNKWWLKYTLPVSITKARCYLNNLNVEIGAGAENVSFVANGNAIRATFDLASGDPSLKCEGLGSFFGIGVGWADELFPDVNLKNPKVSLAFGTFRVVDGKALYQGSGARFDGSVDAHNTPEPIEDFIDLLKDFRGKIDRKVEAKLRAAIDDDDVRAGIAKAIEVIAENTAGETIDDRICDIEVGGGVVSVFYEPRRATVFPMTPVFKR